jgi:pimeloyl-ACP methyl ester carboxylesterase
MARVEFPSGRISFIQLPQVGRGAERHVVMIHGLGASLGFWYASAVQWFRRFATVTLLDLPGHGDSEMPVTGYAPARLAHVVDDLLSAIEIRHAHLVAHSFGGTVALAYAALRPERVESLILADVRLWSVEPPETSVIANPLDGAGGVCAPMAGTLDPSVQMLVDLARSRLDHEDPVVLSDPDLGSGARALFPGRRAARRWLRLIETTSAYEEMTDPAGLSSDTIAAISQPILALYGDLSARKASGLALRDLCPQCQLHVVPTVGHFFPLLRPRLFARPALAFLRSVARENRARRAALRPLDAPATRATFVPAAETVSALTLEQTNWEKGELPAAACRLS